MPFLSRRRECANSLAIGAPLTCLPRSETLNRCEIRYGVPPPYVGEARRGGFQNIGGWDSPHP